MIITRTPYRISFFGGGSDYPTWLDEHRGMVLVTTIDKYCYITNRYLPPFFKHRFRVVWSRIEEVRSAHEIKHPAIRAVLTDWEFNDGLEIHHEGDLPARSGLGSSSAFTVGFLNSMMSLTGKESSPAILAQEAIRFEHDVMKESVGRQDQIATSFGGFNKITFEDNLGYSLDPTGASPERLEELNQHLILVYTGISRTASETAVHYVNTLKAKSANIYRMIELVDEAEKILTSGTPIEEFGQLIDETWQRKKDLSDNISNSSIDEMLDSAKSAGAIGGKLLGAGAGGFLLIFVSPEKRNNVIERLSKLITVPFKFENKGSQAAMIDRTEKYPDLADTPARELQPRMMDIFDAQQGATK
jgi:D-glycero-alpha-D-manno-heptose-7-phosphate kinase